MTRKARLGHIPIPASMRRHIAHQVWLVIGAVACLATPAWGQSAEVLDLEELVLEARARHPSAMAARHSAAALHQVPSRARSLPDPMLMTSVQNLRWDELALDGHPMTGVVVGLSQRLPFPGKLARRERVARSAASVADDRVDTIEDDIELRVRKLYWELHYAERAAALTAENEGVLDMLTDVVVARFGVGQGAQQDAAQAQVAHSRLRAQLMARREAVVSARRALQSALGRQPGADLPPTAALPARRALPSRDTLVALVKRHNAMLSVAASQVVVAQDALAEARHDRWPDFQLSLGYRARAAATGDASAGADMISFAVGVSLPVWAGSKQNARVREQHHRLDHARSSLDALTLDVVTTAERTLDALERLDAQLTLYEKELLPQADQALDASIADYQVGKVGFVSVLQNWRTLLDVQLDHERLEADRAQRFAELGWLAGSESMKETP